MTTLTGMLLDVSESMAENAGEIQQEEGEWVNSIYQFIDNLAKHKLSSENEVFVVGVGAMNGSSGIFDVLKTIKPFTNIGLSDRNILYESILEDIYSILEKNGARQIRKWAQCDTVKSVLKYDIATEVLHYLKSETDFAKKVVQYCLPDVCRDWAAASSSPVNLSYIGECAYSSFITTFRKATIKEITKVRSKIIQLMVKAVNSESVISADEASAIIHGCIGDHTQLDARRMKVLKEIVRPIIYDGTPLFEALRKITPLFHNANDKKKLLFILSDGESTDEGEAEKIKRNLHDVGVTVVSCYVTRSQNIVPRHLFSKPNQQWEDSAQFLFNLSSTIKTQSLPRTLFVKQGWKVDIDNNETRLFLHVNHPDLISEVCDLARNVVCSQDALSDILTLVSMDIYINQSTTKFKAQTQVKSTCYANASAAVVYLSLKRILGRHDGYPDFDTLRQGMIDNYGLNAAFTYDVLKSICPKYRLHCRKVDVVGAMKAITEKRPVVAEFSLTTPEWHIFEEFYNNTTGILSKNELDIRKRTGEEKLYGHAVVLTSFNSECLYLMNSWGDKWADMGFFRVQSADVLDLEFIDVYWTKEDLYDSEKVYYQKHGAQVAADLIDYFKGLQQAKYTCPLCDTESFVIKFTGTLVNATCPSCEGSFTCGESGNILALNMYLLSLTR